MREARVMSEKGFNFKREFPRPRVCVCVFCVCVKKGGRRLVFTQWRARAGVGRGAGRSTDPRPI